MPRVLCTAVRTCLARVYAGDDRGIDRLRATDGVWGNGGSWLMSVCAAIDTQEEQGALHVLWGRTRRQQVAEQRLPQPYADHVTRVL